MSQSYAFAFDESPRGAGGTGATEQIAQVLTDSGVDVPASLYDEALNMAQEGRLAPATERLRMLLVLDPSDASAALLLGKVLASRGQWQEALSQLDSASEKGARVPSDLRDDVELRLRRQVQESESHRVRASSQTQGELRSLRQQAKRLRSENAVMEGQVEELSKRVRVWSGATALVAGASAALLLAVMIFGGPTAQTEDDGLPPASASVSPPVTAPLSEPVVAPTNPAASVPTAAPTAVPTTAQAPTAAPAPPATSPVGESRHIVQKGETLGHISRKYYGKSSEWRRILKANRDVLPTEKALQPGMTLRIPK